MVVELKEEQAMTESTDAQIRHVYEQWHETIKVRDLDGLMALYAEDAVIETPFILAVLKDSTRGVLKARPASGTSSRPDFAIPKAAWAAGTGPDCSSPTAGSWSGNIRGRHRRAIRSTWSK